MAQCVECGARTFLSMAECVASAFCVKLNAQRRPVRERGFSGQITSLKSVQRFHSSYKLYKT